jgi:hypothetical protein
MNNIFSSRAVTAGIIAGTLDILAAFIQYYIKTGKGPAGVLKFIASGIFGESAFTSGNIMIIAGLLFHFIIAVSFTVFFFWLSSKLPSLLHYKFITAVLYGIFTWCIMQFIVLPLSNAPRLPLNVKGVVTAISILIVCIGFPVVYFAARYQPSKSS